MIYFILSDQQVMSNPISNQGLNACDGAIDTFKVSWSDYLTTLSPNDFMKFKEKKALGFDVL